MREKQKKVQNLSKKEKLIKQKQNRKMRIENERQRQEIKDRKNVCKRERERERESYNVFTLFKFFSRGTERAQYKCERRGGSDI